MPSLTSSKLKHSTWPALLLLVMLTGCFSGPSRMAPSPFCNCVYTGLDQWLNQSSSCPTGTSPTAQECLCQAWHQLDITANVCGGTWQGALLSCDFTVNFQSSCPSLTAQCGQTSICATPYDAGSGDGSMVVDAAVGDSNIDANPTCQCIDNINQQAVQAISQCSALPSGQVACICNEYQMLDQANQSCNISWEKVFQICPEFSAKAQIQLCESLGNTCGPLKLCQGACVDENIYGKPGCPAAPDAGTVKPDGAKEAGGKDAHAKEASPKDAAAKDAAAKDAAAKDAAAKDATPKDAAKDVAAGEKHHG